MGSRHGVDGSDRTTTVRRLAVTAITVSTLVAALVLLTLQTQVSDGRDALPLACGSALDVIVDRSGWEHWWAADLDTPTDSIDAPLTRTLRCPHAINRRTAWAGVLAGVGAASLLVDRRHRPPRKRSTTSANVRLRRLGRATGSAGVLLCALGSAALLQLLADADAPMFRYVDRLSVVAIGAIALTPVTALVAIGRSIILLSDHLDDGERGEHG